MTTTPPAQNEPSKEALAVAREKWAYVPEAPVDRLLPECIAFARQIDTHFAALRAELAASRAECTAIANIASSSRDLLEKETASHLEARKTIAALESRLTPPQGLRETIRKSLVGSAAFYPDAKKLEEATDHLLTAIAPVIAAEKAAACDKAERYVRISLQLGDRPFEQAVDGFMAVFRQRTDEMFSNLRRAQAAEAQLQAIRAALSLPSGANLETAARAMYHELREARALVGKYKSSVAELLGWTCLPIDEGSGQTYWRNEDRSIATVDALEQIDTSPDAIYGALNAWNDSRKESLALKTLVARKDGELTICRRNIADMDERLTLMTPVRDNIRESHASMARHNAGQLGMPQGPCTCLICKPDLNEISESDELATAQARVKELEQDGARAMSIVLNVANSLWRDAGDPPAHPMAEQAEALCKKIAARTPAT